MALMEIGIDLGTANIVVHSKKKGVIINEPSRVSIDTKTKKVVGFGNEAREMIGKTPRNIVVMQPLKNGAITDFDVTAEMLKYIMDRIKKTIGFSLRKPDIAVCAPYGSTPVERRAIQDVVKHAGARKVYVIEEPIAAAIGADLPVEEPTANMIVDIGGGTTESAIISCEGIVVCYTSRAAGDELDESIVQYVRKKYNLLITERTAEIIKMEVGYAPIDHDVLSVDIKGKDLLTGLPKTIAINSYEFQEATSETLASIMETIRKTFESSPPELTGDIIDRGITLIGGGALLNGMQEWINQEFSIPVHVVANPQEAVAIGTGRSLPLMLKVEKVAK